MTHNLSQLPLVTTSVVSSSDSSIVLPWTIIQFDELYSVADFFTMTIKPRLEIDECLLQDARVGQAAHLLVLVDMNLPLMAIIPTFGRFLQFKVSISDPTKVTVDSNEPQEVALYIPVIPERNRKDALYNKIVSFFKSTSLGLLEEEISSGKKLISCLRDVFWYIDGHHHVFERVNKPIPTAFSVFVGYNVPELSKHRKRRTLNLSADQLRDFALTISSMLLENYWERTYWRDAKQHFLDLSECLSTYSEYLVEKNKRMKANHRSPTPVRELPENSHLKLLLPATEPIPPSLKAIEEFFQSLPDYKYSSLTDLLPHDSLKKHRLLNLLISSGLSFPSMLFIYSAGGSVGNLQFLWRLPQEPNDPNNYFEQSQSVVEEVKLLLPTFHTRAMRKVLFQKFGRVSTGVKPSILRYFYKELTGEVRHCSIYHMVQIFCGL